MESFLKQFENDKPKNPKPLGLFTINFGKHKGKTYKEIYENDKNYVKYIVTLKDDKYIKKIKQYFLSRIEVDYPPEL